MRIFSISLFLFLSLVSRAQKLDLLFTGDVMAHDDQLASAWYEKDSTWDFRIWFSEIEHVFKSADYCIGNLEVPLE